MKLSKRVTFEEYWQLPETNTFLELIDGEVIASGAREPIHQEALSKILSLISKLRGDGEILPPPVVVYLDEYNALEPDIFWVSPEHRHILTNTHIIGAPDLVVEILSPYTAKRDKTIKFGLYQRYSVKELWYADPVAEYLEVWTLVDGAFKYIGAYGAGDTFESPLLGQAVDVTAIFPPAEQTQP